MTPFHATRFHIKPQPTDIYGLRYFPSLEPECSNDRDMPPFGNVNSLEVTEDNRTLVSQVVHELGNKLTAIIEIGVNRNLERSMSQILINDRPQGSFYLGIDIEDKSYLDNPNNNTWTIKCNSNDQHAVRNFLTNKGITQIDLLFIDGWHSVNTCINDWKYADLLSPHGVVMMHDTNSHPGPIALFEAINDELFLKERYFQGFNDNGIAIIKRR